MSKILRMEVFGKSNRTQRYDPYPKIYIISLHNRRLEATATGGIIKEAGGG